MPRGLAHLSSGWAERERCFTAKTLLTGMGFQVPWRHIWNSKVAAACADPSQGSIRPRETDKNKVANLLGFNILVPSCQFQAVVYQHRGRSWALLLLSTGTVLHLATGPAQASTYFCKAERCHEKCLLQVSFGEENCRFLGPNAFETGQVDSSECVVHRWRIFILCNQVSFDVI